LSGDGGLTPDGAPIGRLRRAAVDSRGMVSTEVAVLVPVVLFGFVLLLVAGGRIVQAESDVQSAAQEAARAATFFDSVSAARAEADLVAAANLETSGLSCAFGRQVALDVLEPASGGSSSAGGLQPDSIVQVAVSCTADLGDVVALGIPGSRTFQAEAFERVDAFRSSP